MTENPEEENRKAGTVDGAAPVPSLAFCCDRQIVVERAPFDSGNHLENTVQSAEPRNEIGKLSTSIAKPYISSRTLPDDGATKEGFDGLYGPTAYSETFPNEKIRAWIKMHIEEGRTVDLEKLGPFLIDLGFKPMDVLPKLRELGWLVDVGRPMRLGVGKL